MNTEVRSRSLPVLEKAAIVILLFQALLIVTHLREPDRFSPETVGPLAATIVFLAQHRRQAAASRGRRVGGWILAWRLGALALLAAITLVVALDRYSLVPDVAPHLLSMMLWALIALKGAAVGKLKPGPLGLRVPWTLKSRLAWDKAHRALGRVLFAGGLLGLAASPFAPFLVSVSVLAGLITTAVAIALYESWRTFRIDPDVMAPGSVAT